MDIKICSCINKELTTTQDGTDGTAAAASTCTLGYLLCPHYSETHTDSVLSPLTSLFSLDILFPRLLLGSQVSYHGGVRLCGSLFSPSSHCPLQVWVPGQKGEPDPACAPQVLEQAPLVLWSPVWGSSPPYPILVTDLGSFKTKPSLSAQENMSSLGSGPHLLFWAAPQKKPSVLFRTLASPSC